MILVAMLVSVLAVLVAWPFLPVIQAFTNSTGVYTDQGTPLDPIVHLFVIWTMAIIILAAVWGVTHSKM